MHFLYIETFYSPGIRMGESDEIKGTKNGRLFPGMGEDGERQMCARSQNLDLPHV